MVQLHLPVTPLPVPRSITGLTGQILTKISDKVNNLSFVISGNHHETGEFFVYDSPNTQLILGYLWLAKHNPTINWSEKRIIDWSYNCSSNCLKSAISASVKKEQNPVEINLSNVPVAYHDLAHMFSKTKACSLPPHRPYDISIDLIPDAPLPSSRLYNLSGPEKETMKNYIKESLETGLIRPSISPLGAGFFFVSKKDKTLRPCIDYRGLNNITIKNKYPLHHIDSIHDRLHSAKIFSKLDLRNAYHLVRIKEGEEWKTAFKAPIGHFEYLVIPFGLTNAPAVFQALINDILRDFFEYMCVCLFRRHSYIFRRQNPTCQGRSSCSPTTGRESTVR